MKTKTQELSVTVIRPRPPWKLLDIKELMHYRDLFYMLVVREIKVRYKQTVLGGLWAILQPFLTMIVFSVIFGVWARMPSDKAPYPVFLFAALVPWTYFANALGYAANSLIADQAFINKVYFPRIAITAAPVFGWLLDFAVASLVLVGMMIYFGVRPTPFVALLPMLTLLMIFAAAGAGMWLAALTVHYRDFRYVVPFIIQLWLFASPIVYPVATVPRQWRLLYSINPMAGIVQGFRSALLGTVGFPWAMVSVSALVSVFLLITGLAYFRSVERAFADVV